MKKIFLKTLSLLMAAILLAACIPVAAVSADDYANAQEVNAKAPIVAVAEQDGEGYNIGDSITPVYKDNKNYLFLPSSANAKALMLMYTGSGKLHLTDKNTDIASNETFVCDVSSGEYTVYETAKDGKLGKYTLTVMQSAKVSSIYINLEGGDADLARIHSDKEESTTGSLLMINADGDVVYDNAIDKFKGHGNTSFVAPGVAADKKSYNLKLAKKAELIEGAGKAKKWTLLHIRVSTAYYYDFTGITTHMAFSTYTSLAGDGYCGVSSEYTDLYINGDYRGTYMLTERIDVGAAIDVTKLDDSVVCDDMLFDCKNPPADDLNGIKMYKYNPSATLLNEDVDITGGYVLEVNFNNIDFDKSGFVTRNGMYVDIKAPEFCTEEMVRYIARYVQDFENAIYSDTGYNSYGKHYTDYCDLKSLADMILTYSFYQNWELFRTSTYMYIDVAESDHPKLTFGPAWDFETGYEIPESDTSFFGLHNVYTDRQQYIWLEKLWQKSDFMDMLLNEGIEMKAIISTLLDRGDAGSAYQMIADATPSHHMNWTRWDYEKLLSNTYKSHKNDFDFYANAELGAYKKRFGVYFGYFNTEEYNFGASVSGYRAASGDTVNLIAKPVSIGDVSYQWYEVDENNLSESYLLDGETENILVAPCEGKYYCVVTGKNNAYSSSSQVKSEVFSKENISISTAIYDTKDAMTDDTHTEHTAGDFVVVKDATCTETGTRVKRCTVCGEVIEREVIPALEHEAGEFVIAKEATCTEDGVRVKYCTKCNAELEAEDISAVGHQIGDWQTVAEPTDKKNGLREKHCTSCNTLLEREIVYREYVNNFNDVAESAWYAEAVKYAVLNYLFDGTSPVTFEPNNNMTRAMLVKVLYSLDGANIGEGEYSKFRDVKAGQWYTKAVIWAERNQIVTGTSFDKFSPNDSITREQTATILYRYADYKNFDVTGENDISFFEDYSSVSNYAKTALSWANNAGIINGMSKTTLAARGKSTRAQVATMIKRFCEKYPETLLNRLDK